jgi:hypothetical protein
MTVIKTEDQLKAVMEDSNSPYFLLYGGNSMFPIQKNMAEKDNKVAFAKLKKALATYGDGFYTIELRTSPNQSRGAIKVGYQYGEKTADNQQTAIAGGFLEKQITTTQQDLVHVNRDYFNLSMDKQRLELENDRLKEKVKDMEGAKGSNTAFVAGLPAMIKSLAPAIAPVIAAWKGHSYPEEPEAKPIPIKGFENTPLEESATPFDALLDRLSTVLQCKNDEELFANLEKLVLLAEANPTMVKNVLFAS